MPAEDLVDEVAKPVTNTPNRSASMRSAPAEEEFDPSGGRTVTEDERGEDVYNDRTGDGRKLSDSVKAKIAAMFADDEDEGAIVVDDSAATEAAPPDAKTETAPTGDSPDVGEKPAPTAEEIAIKGTGSGDAELRAAMDRIHAQNLKLIAERDAAKKQTPNLAPHHKRVTEAADNYVDDQVTAIRTLIAAGLGIEDINDPQVTTELRDVYADLTAQELGTSVDGTAHQAKREAARAKQLFAREKRQRKAQEQATQQAPEVSDAERIAKTGEFVSGRMTAEAFPLLHALSTDIDGDSPGVAVAKILKREIETGRIDPTQPDDVLIKHAATIAETRYRSVVAKATAAQKPNPTSTERPNDQKSSAAATSERTESRQSHGARNLTAADASVAPAKPPATKPKTDEKPKFKNRDERIAHSMRLLKTKH